MIGIIGVALMRERTRFAIRQQLTLGRTSWLTRMIRATEGVTISIFAITVTLVTVLVTILVAIGAFLNVAITSALLGPGGGFDVCRFGRREPRGSSRDSSGGFRSGFGNCGDDCGGCGRVSCDDVFDCQDRGLRSLRSWGAPNYFHGAGGKFRDGNVLKFLFQAFLLFS
jgi:hypothetical protein